MTGYGDGAGLILYAVVGEQLRVLTPARHRRPRLPRRIVLDTIGCLDTVSPNFDHRLQSK
ncbi:MAG: hypothetical protein ACRER6_07150 [Pseudomonas sp.]